MASSIAIEVSRVVNPAYRVAVGLEPVAVTGPELGKGTSVGRLGQQLFGWVHW